MQIISPIAQRKTYLHINVKVDEKTPENEILEQR